jgi:two-component system sporulation sensor kinase B
MVGIKDLLLNILIIIIGILIHNSIRIEKRYEKLYIAILAVSGTVLCMLFPFTILPGNLYDLRIIPILLGFLYGGYGIGFASMLAALLYRYFLGGYGFLTALYGSVAVALVILPFVKPYQTYHQKQRILTAMAIALASSVFISGIGLYRLYVSHLLSGRNPWIFFTGFCMVHVLAMWISVHLIENMRESKAMEAEVQKAEKLHVLGELAASIAHEIRNPMTVVRGFIQLLSERSTNPEDRRFMQMIIGELDRAEAIINDYLTLTNPQLDKRDTFDLGESVRHIANVLSSYAKLHNVEIQVKSEGPCPITTHQGKLSQVLVNLMKNGIEAMEDGGILQIHVFRKGEGVVIEIIDSGVGMTLEEINRLGTPFYSTKEKGTGLGVMASYRIVQMMNGKIQVHSAKGKGTRFSIFLPLSPQKGI